MQSETLAERAGCGRVATEEGVEQSQAGAGGEQWGALACPAARPRPGRNRRRRRKGLAFRRFRRSPLRSRVPRKRRGDAVAGVDDGLRSEVQIDANHLGMVKRGSALPPAVGKYPPRFGRANKTR